MGAHAHGAQGDPLGQPGHVTAPSDGPSRRPLRDAAGRVPRRPRPIWRRWPLGPGQAVTSRPSRSWCAPRTPTRTRSPAADRRRGGRAGRGPGVVPAGLPGAEALPGRRPVHDLAVPDHRQLRVDPPGQARAGTATTSSPTTSWSSTPTRSATPPPGPTPPSCGTGSSVALDDLPPKLRAVVVLRDVYDLPHEAIAAELGISESAAKVRLHRARRKLRGAACSRARSDPTTVTDGGGPPCGVTTSVDDLLRRGRRRHGGRRPRPPGATSSAACAARPTSSSTASCCGPSAPCAPRCSSRRPGLLAEILAHVEEAGERHADPVAADRPSGRLRRRPRRGHRRRRRGRRHRPRHPARRTPPRSPAEPGSSGPRPSACAGAEWDRRTRC